MAIISNLTIDQGSTFSVDIDVTDSDGDALDLTDFTVQGQMRKTYTSSTATTFVSEITNATGGVVTISLTAATTNALKAGRYVYDVEITSPASVVTRIVEGQVEVTPGVTQV